MAIKRDILENSKTKRNNFSGEVLSWSTFAVVVGLSFLVWADGLSWSFSGIQAVSLFPLLGLWAWTVMWTHYSLAAIRFKLPNFKKSSSYSVFSGWFVLATILLHPIILAVGQDRQLGIKPPASFYEYVAPSMKIFVFMGVLGLLGFLFFEVIERFKSKKIVSDNWFVVSISQMIAMTLIFIHSLQIGQHLQTGWFMIFWLTLGALLVPSFVVVGLLDYRYSQQNR